MTEEADRLSRIEASIDKLVERFDKLVDEGAKTRITVAELSATLRTHTERQTERTAARDLRCIDHEGRIRCVEQAGADEHGKQIEALQTEVRQLREWRARIAGIGAAIGAGGGFGLSKLFGG